MKKHLFFFFVLSSLLLTAQQKEEKIAWDRNRPLTWSDFKAKPDPLSNFTANTNSGMGYGWDYSTISGEPEFTYSVSCNFYPQLSWVKKPADPEYLLDHEQLHFDISELHARKLGKILSEYEPGRTVRLDLRQIYNKMESERIAMQKQFDKETQHSENHDAEMAWRKKIAQELKSLEAYATDQN